MEKQKSNHFSTLTWWLNSMVMVKKAVSPRSWRSESLEIMTVGWIPLYRYLHNCTCPKYLLGCEVLLTIFWVVCNSYNRHFLCSSPIKQIKLNCLVPRQSGTSLSLARYRYNRGLTDGKAKRRVICAARKWRNITGNVSKNKMYLMESKYFIDN